MVDKEGVFVGGSTSEREGGGWVGLVWRIMMLGVMSITKQLDDVALIINYLKKSRLEGGVNS